jgi:hypothetical protein
MTDPASTRNSNGGLTKAAYHRLVRTFLAGAALATLLLASVAAAAPGAPPKYVRKTSGPVLSLAADGDRAAFIVEGRVKECWSVMVWQPARRRIHRLQSAAACESNDRPNRRGLPTVALAGTRAAWLWITGGNNLETIISSATVARPKPVWLAYGAADDGVAGSFVRQPAGDGSLLAFTSEVRCHPAYEGSICPPSREPGDITEATVWRVGGNGRCSSPLSSTPVRCSVVAKADSELSVLAVDAGRIAVRTETGLRLFTAAGRALRDIDVKPQAAALSGNRLAVRTASAVEVYDTENGDRLDQLSVPKAVRLEDLDGDILVTAWGGTVTLRRLGDGSTTRIGAGRTGLAQLERPGLFVASGRRVTFIPMRDVLRRLGEAGR